jgi:hypothetical protein
VGNKYYLMYIYLINTDILLLYTKDTLMHTRLIESYQTLKIVEAKQTGKPMFTTPVFEQDRTWAPLFYCGFPWRSYVAHNPS